MYRFIIENSYNLKGYYEYYTIHDDLQQIYNNQTALTLCIDRHRKKVTFLNAYNLETKIDVIKLIGDLLEIRNAFEIDDYTVDVGVFPYYINFELKERL